MTRPAKITCVRCGGDGHPSSARQAVVSWPLSACGAGTMTNAAELFETDVWLCSRCWQRRFGKVRSPALWPFFDRIAQTLRLLVVQWCGTTEPAEQMNVLEQGADAEPASAAAWRALGIDRERKVG